MDSKDMRVWQVLALGTGFIRDGIEQGCEIAGFVRADSPDDAFSKACNIAMKVHPELLQATGRFPRPVINAEEIEELFQVDGMDIEKVEVYWVKE